MLLALAVIALAVAGVAIAYFLTHRDNELAGHDSRRPVDRSDRHRREASLPVRRPAQARRLQQRPPPRRPRTDDALDRAVDDDRTDDHVRRDLLLPTTATMPDVSSQKETAAVQALNQAGILPSLVLRSRGAIRSAR